MYRILCCCFRPSPQLAVLFYHRLHSSLLEPHRSISKNEQERVISIVRLVGEGRVRDCVVSGLLREVCQCESPQPLTARSSSGWMARRIRLTLALIMPVLGTGFAILRSLILYIATNGLHPLRSPLYTRHSSWHYLQQFRREGGERERRE